LEALLSPFEHHDLRDRQQKHKTERDYNSGSEFSLGGKISESVFRCGGHAHFFKDEIFMEQSYVEY